MRWSHASVLVLATACTHTTVTGVDVQSVATAVLRGTVTNAQVGPVEGATVAAEQIWLDCGTRTEEAASWPRDASTDSDGTFSLSLGLIAAPGQHCVDLLVALAEHAVSHTTRGVPVVFGESLRDTTTVVIEVAW